MRAILLAACLALGAASGAEAAAPLSVVYAGSMGAVMDRGIGPAFTAKTGIPVQGQGQGALGLARLIASGTIHPDVFVSVSAPPIRIVEGAGLAAAGAAVPVASPALVLAYAPGSRFADAIRTGGVGALTSPGLRLGRTDPASDPLGQYSLFALLLAERQLGRAGFAAAVAGAPENPAQIFAEPSVLARLAAGQLDASFAYQAFAVSQHVPFVTLPPALNFSDPARAADYAGLAEAQAA